MYTDAQAEEVWQFWFGGDQREKFRKLWFPTSGAEAQAAADAEVTARFGSLLDAAEGGALAAWEATPATMTALIVARLVLCPFAPSVLLR